MARCRCHSRRQEKRCCGPLHAGAPAPSPEALMRSRYAAYAKGLADYILDTTDPEGPHWRTDSAAWRDEVIAFCRATRFEGLEILEAPEPEGDRATVTFHAALTQGGRDVGFRERSVFRRVGGRWLYRSAAGQD